jgi:glycosyltransferase involved in cell wall biosynthesis
MAPIPASQVTVALEGWNASDLDNRALFERSLRSLVAQTYPVQTCEALILMDEAAIDGCADWVRSFFPDARLVPVAASTYFRVKNAALDQATREVMVFADSDVAYAPNWLESMLGALSQQGGVVAGNTQFDDGFLSRTLNLTEWAATRQESGPTDWFYGNNVAAKRSLFQRYRFREDFGHTGAGGVDVMRARMLRDGIPIWFCAEARGWHHLAPFWTKYTRLGAFQIHFRRMAPETRWSWLARVPIFAPCLIGAGLLVKAWQRAWELRRSLPLHGWTLPIYVGTIAFVKSVELIGAVQYAWFPSFTTSRHDWFDTPDVNASEVASI